MISEGDNAIYGLVLAGGKSVRMGEDKGMLPWHGKPQRYYVADLLSGFCEKVYISCREEQLAEIDPAYPALADTYTGIGPVGAILTAMEKHPGKAWLVLACDLPLIDAETLEFLIANRDPETIATTFESPHDGLPEPLITIWEPSAYSILLERAKEGIKCPRKVLINNNTTILKAPDAAALMNANTPADAETAKNIINQKYVGSK